MCIYVHILHLIKLSKFFFLTPVSCSLVLAVLMFEFLELFPRSSKCVVNIMLYPCGNPHKRFYDMFHKRCDWMNPS